jgi:hypothetical protein
MKTKLKHTYDINEGLREIIKKQFIKAFLSRLHINDLANW